MIAAVLLGSLTGCGPSSGDDAPRSTPTASIRSTLIAEATPGAGATATRELTPTVQPTKTQAGPDSITTPQPTTPVAELQPSTKLAYFHSRSPDGDPPEVLAQRAQFIILTFGDEVFRDALRVAGYDGLILQYLNASQVNGPGPYQGSGAVCDAEFEPSRNGIVRNAGAFCRDLHPHEDWFLHNGIGERLYSIIGDTQVWYHMNPANPEWRAYASQAIASDLIGPRATGFDGVFLDNVELSLTRLTEQVVNADGTVREFTTDNDYRNAWEGYLGQIRARAGQDRHIWASLVSDPNTGSTWAGYLAHLDGVMSPAFATGYDPLTVAKWENNLAQAEAAIVGGKGLAAVGLGAQRDETLQQFALASYLLISDGEHVFFRYMSNELNEAVHSIWMYPNYEIKLGAALGPRRQVGRSWRREFQCGYVEVDPAIRAGTIVQTSCENGTVP